MARGELPVDVEKEESGRKPSLLRYLVLPVVAVAVVALRARLGRDTDCSSSLLTDGQWVGGAWHAHSCILHSYQDHEVLPCLTQRGYGQVVFNGGDDAEESKNKLKETVVSSSKGIGPTLEFFFLPVESPEEEYSHLAQILEPARGSVLLIYKPRLLPWKECKVALELVVASQQLLLASSDSLLVVLAPSEAADSKCLEFLQELYFRLNHSSIFLTPPSLPPGVSSTHGDLPLELSLVFNLFCNSPLDATCCVPTLRRYVSSFVSPLLLIVLAVLLGIWLVFASGATFALAPHLEALSFDIKRFLTVVNCVGCFTAVLFFMLLTDRLDFFIKVAVRPSPLVFVVLVCGIIVCAVLTLVPSETPDLLPLHLVRESRGLAILLLIVVDYTAADKLFPAARLRELSVGAVLFLTTYLHFTGMWLSGDFHWIRVCKKIFKLNLILVCVCLAMGSSYGAYYLVPLVTLWFLLVLSFAFVAMWLILLRSTDKDSPTSQVTVGLLFVVAFLLVSLLPAVKEVFVGLLSLPLVREVAQSFDGNPEEIFCIFNSIRYMPLCGMLVGYVAVSQQKRLAKCSVRVRLVAVLITSVALMVFYLIPESHPASSLKSILIVVPVLWLLLLRNMTTKLGGLHSNFLSTAGSLYLWLFVSHYHILMAQNGKGLLVLIPSFYYMNLVAVGIVFLFVSVLVHQSCTTLNKLFL